ncbi:MAG: Na(+)/H(+) antiporter subunit B [Gammaproteobacteria bacterium]
MTWFLLAIVVIMLGGGLAALLLRSHLAAVASVSIVSLGLSVLFVVLRAPDVAMTEAAVGAGLSGVILALALRRLGLARLDEGAGSVAQRTATRRELP